MRLSGGRWAGLYYPVQDANFNVAAVFDSDGKLVERYAYKPYGERAVYVPTDGNDTYGNLRVAHTQLVEDESGVAQPYGVCDFGHQGLMLDKATGQYYNRRRQFDPGLGRWTSRDPLGYVDGMNLYGYCGNAPRSFVDPWGLELQWHHRLPQEVFGTTSDFAHETEFYKLLDEGLDIHSAHYGWMLDDAVHPKLHGLGWNAEWKEWAMKQLASGKRVTRGAVRSQLADMMQTAKYRKIFKSGFKARYGFNSRAYRAAIRGMKKASARAVRRVSGEALERSLKIASRKAGREIGESLAKKTLIVVAFAAVDLAARRAEGEEVDEAVLNTAIGVIPVAGEVQAVYEVYKAFLDTAAAAERDRIWRILHDQRPIPEGLESKLRFHHGVFRQPVPDIQGMTIQQYYNHMMRNAVKDLIMEGELPWNLDVEEEIECIDEREGKALERVRKSLENGFPP